MRGDVASRGVTQIRQRKATDQRRSTTAERRKPLAVGGQACATL